MAKGAVIVAGMPASGKTAVISGTTRKLRRFKVVTVGTLTADAAIKEGIVKDRDRLRYINIHAIDRLRHAAFASISRLSGFVIINTHASVEQNGRFIAGLPKGEMAKLKLKGLVYIDADPRAIVKRRARDSSRSREKESVHDLEVQRTFDLSTLAHYASDLNIPLYIIHNKEGALRESQKSFVSAINDIFGEK